MMPEHYFKPWGEIDQSLKDGGIPDVLQAGYVGPDLGDNAMTKSVTLFTVFETARDWVRSISMHPAGMREGQPDKAIMEEVLKGMNAVFEQIVDETHTDATKFFTWTHAIPPNKKFGLAPIRYPLRMPFADRAVDTGIGLLVEIAELNRNAAHRGLRPQDADRLIAPLYDLKSYIIKHFFDLEVAGEISSGELLALFDGKYRPGPTVSRPDQSAELPEGAAVDEALSGVDVLQWYPAKEEWTSFARLTMQRYTPERIYQPEGAFPTTEDVAYEQTVDTSGAARVTSAGQP